MAVDRVFAIGRNTFREAVRDKILYGLVGFAVVFMGFALALSAGSLHEERRVILDLGLAGLSLFGVVTAVVVGVNLVYKEIDRKTIYVILPKPLRRWEFVVGKLCGLALTLALVVLVMGAALAAALVMAGQAPGGALIRALVLSYAELLLVTAVALFFSSFSSPILSGLFTLGVWIIGRLREDVFSFLSKTNSTVSKAPLAGIALHNPPLHVLFTGIRWLVQVLPDLHLFYVSGGLVGGQYATVHESYVDWQYVAQAGAYGLGYGALTVIAACVLFSRRDFT
jgi:ABC-type transport system involved in multi-copper enzyme maturation permease subunit